MKIHQMGLRGLPSEPTRLLKKHMQGHQAAQIAKKLLQVRKQAQMMQMQGAQAMGGPQGNGATPGRVPQPGGLDDIFRSMPRETY